MSNKFGTCADRHSLVRHGYETGGQLMDTRRTCTRCLQKRTQKGGRTQRGSNFICAICVAKIKGVDSENEPQEFAKRREKNVGKIGP